MITAKTQTKVLIRAYVNGDTLGLVFGQNQKKLQKRLKIVKKLLTDAFVYDILALSLRKS